MKRVGFIVHVGRGPAVDAACGLVAWLRERGVATRQVLGERVGADEETEAGAFPEGLDLVVSVGGDGTFLRAARIASRTGAPVLGVKVGRVGFLTEVDPEGAAALIQHVIDGTALIEDRLAVLAEPDGTAWFEPQWGLNEVIVEKLAPHRLIRLAVSVDGEYVTTFSADGVIVATPTGSTAYSFSARGPIVSPSLSCLVITPIAAHMVFDRSFVLGADETVTLEIVGEEPGLLTADGRDSFELPVGARVRIAPAPHPARLVRRHDGTSFFGLVREKFGLPLDPGTAGVED